MHDLAQPKYATASEIDELWMKYFGEAVVDLAAGKDPIAVMQFLAVNRNSFIESVCNINKASTDQFAAKLIAWNKAMAAAKAYDVNSKNNNEVRRLVWEKTGGRCVYCDCSLDNPSHAGSDTMQVDHLVPLSRGGPDTLANYVPSCQPCNSGKRDRDPVEFVLRLRGKQSSENVIPIESAS